VVAVRGYQLVVAALCREPLELGLRGRLREGIREVILQALSIISCDSFVALGQGSVSAAIAVLPGTLCGGAVARLLVKYFERCERFRLLQRKTKSCCSGGQELLRAGETPRWVTRG